MTINTDLYHDALNLLRRSTADEKVLFREHQWEAVEDLCERQARLLIVQRTGWGKSIVYFLATKILRERGAGPTLLISPLLALMRNQLIAADRIGIQAATVNSSNRDEWDAIQKELLENQIDLLMISPERLANDAFREEWLLPVSDRIGLFVVDEAHCISDWGHDFRPDYLRVVRVLQVLPPNIPVLATTATANDRVVEDIVNQFGAHLKVFRGELARDSLRLQNIHLPSKSERMAWLLDHLPSLPGSGVIYTLTIRDAQQLALWLQSQGIDAHPYWGGLDSDERVALEEELLNNQIKVLVATTALGMGFDKPDLGFVIHFQRPASVVHYYQQVGRAGRAVEEAYGILLSGEEDQEITDYFIQSAFPPEAHVGEVLGSLRSADGGLSVYELQKEVNLTKSQIEKVLKLLAVQYPAPVSKQEGKWLANPVGYSPNTEKVERITNLRKEEQAKMLEYLDTDECLMLFLRQELNDPASCPCGICANCLGHPIVPVDVSRKSMQMALEFLQRCDVVIPPRKRWPYGVTLSNGWQGNIQEELQAEEGRALCMWGDSVYGELVRRGKQVNGMFDGSLVQGACELIFNRWSPDPFPMWVTCVPSLRNQTLVPSLAIRIAQSLDLPFVEVVQKVKNTAPQKLMQNSAKQVMNLDGAFIIKPWSQMNGSLLLIDDMVDSRWTFTLVTALLRSAGSGFVFPFALASVQAGQDW